MPQHPERLLPLKGTSNFRDLGGYPGEGGRPVRWRRLFRSEHLAGLTPEDHRLLAGLGLSRAVDFRGDTERAATPYAVPGVRHIALAIEPTVVQQMQALTSAGRRLTPELVSGLMEDLYRALVNDRAPQFAALFAHLLDERDEGGLVFHCTAGKDRTGFAAALVLAALGVPRPLIEADYLLTNQHYQHPPLVASETPIEVLKVLWTVQPRFLDAALDAVDRDHGGLERYLSDRMKLSPAARRRLVQRYLEA